MTLLAPLDIVSARGQASVLFGFEYLWEVYKPADKRRWVYYMLPILYGDQLVARLDPRLERKTKTLVIQGFWAEPEAQIDDLAFADALARGLARFARFHEAERIALAPLVSPLLSERVEKRIGEQFLLVSL